LAANLIGSAGGDSRAVHRAVEANLAKLPKVEVLVPGQVMMAPRDGASVRSGRGDRREGRRFLCDVERMLLALVLAKAPTRPTRSASGVKAQAAGEGDRRPAQGRTADSASAEGSYDALKKYCPHLTQAAREGKLDPVIGRDEEIRRTIQVLSRRQQEQSVLIGEPGVGKDAIAGGPGAAHRQYDVPESLKGKKLMALDLGA